jgi:hypothetical protein
VTAPLAPADRAELDAALRALQGGRPDDAVTRLEALADRGVEGAGIAYDRGLAYAARARSREALPGDLGRAAHAFEDALRRTPWDADARTALDEVRKAIAGRDARAGGRSMLVDAAPAWRGLVVAAPGNVWAGLAMLGSLVTACALGVRPRLVRGARLAASTLAVVGLLLGLLGSALALGARWLRTHVHEAVVVAPHAVGQSDGEAPSFDLPEGARVDVLEEGTTSVLVRSARGTGWVARESLRPLPPWRP